MPFCKSLNKVCSCFEISFLKEFSPGRRARPPACTAPPRSRRRSPPSAGRRCAWRPRPWPSPRWCGPGRWCSCPSPACSPVVRIEGKHWVSELPYMGTDSGEANHFFCKEKKPKSDSLRALQGRNFFKTVANSLYSWKNMETKNIPPVSSQTPSAPPGTASA